METEEKVYFTDGRVTITNARAILGDKTYAMANITSVSMGELPPNRTVGIMLIIVGVISALYFMCSPAWRLYGLILGGLLVGFGIWALSVPKPSFVVKIGSASGESNALQSNNKDYIHKIVNSVNEAIINRG